ncbi:hypothetical protein RJ640_000135 [Escallonia rubra]|uniref:protein-serine/threonine phosphatase n=1 Tax=Escallonia rubra TaxID=112253 RepID=A0AA88QTG6_9ASTE|nr:hypothetical protein RJ640_000135 [Escallonia rubra]
MKVQLSELEIRQLCLRSKDIFLQQPNLLELEAPIKICGSVLERRTKYTLALVLTGLFHFGTRAYYLDHHR